MSLAKRAYNVTLRGGIEQKINRNLVTPAKLLDAVNVEFGETNTVSRRTGYVQSSDAFTGFNDALRLFDRSGSPVVEFLNGAMKQDGGRVYGSISVAKPNRFMRLGSETRRLQSLLSKPNFQGQPTPHFTYNHDMVVVGSVKVMMWEAPNPLQNNNPMIMWDIREIATDKVLASGSKTTKEFNVKPRILADGDSNICMLWAVFDEGASEYEIWGAVYKTNGSVDIDDQLIKVISGRAVVESSISTIVAYDADIDDRVGYIGIACNNTNGFEINCFTIDTSLSVITDDTYNISETPLDITVKMYSASGLWWAFYSADGSGIVSAIDTSYSGGTTFGELLIASVPSGVAGRIVAVVSDRQFVGGYDWAIFYDCYGASAEYSIGTGLVIFDPTNGTQGPNNIIDTKCYLGSRAFTLQTRENTISIPLVFGSLNYQGTLFMLNASQAIRGLDSLQTTTPVFLARIDYGEVPWTYYGGNKCPRGQRMANSHELATPYLKYEVNTIVAGNENATPICISQVSLQPQAQLSDVVVNDVNYLAGAMPFICDGIDIVEENFNWGPEVIQPDQIGSIFVSPTIPIVLTPVATGTGIYTFENITATYQMYFTEAWQDARGNWHESAPSNLAQVTITTGSPSRSINPVIQRPSTLKPGSKLIMYRTVGTSADTTFYRTHTLDLGNNVTGNYISNSALPNSEAIYTSGGVLANNPMPACKQLAVYQDRIFISSCGTANRFYWSKTYEPGFGVECVVGSNAFQQTVPPMAGNVVGTQEMSGRLIVLCTEVIGCIFGNGPDDTGLQGAYVPFETMIRSIGIRADAPKSICSNLDGVWFQSSQGIRLVSAGGALSAIGPSVDPLVGASPIVGLSITDNKSQTIKFIQPTNYAIVYDSNWGQFTTWTNSIAVDACKSRDTYYIMQGTVLRYLSRNVYFDVTASGTTNYNYTANINTSWIQLADIQGFQRIYSMMLLGNATDNPTVSLSVNYEYATSAAGVEMGAIVIPRSSGTGNTAFQFRHQFTRQKCQAIQIGISFSPKSAANVLINLSDIALEVGLKKSPYHGQQTL